MANDMKGLADVYARAAVNPVAQRLRELEKKDHLKELAQYDGKPVADYYLGNKKRQLIAEQGSDSEFGATLKQMHDMSYELFEIGSRIKYNQTKPEDADYLHDAARKMEKLASMGK